MSELLKDFPVTHAAIRPIFHPELKTTVYGRSVVRYLRFLHPVRIERLELRQPKGATGRWVPDVPVHPAHLLISRLDAESGCWQIVQEVKLPYDPRIAGEELSQTLPIEQQESHFADLFGGPPLVIQLNGIETDHLKVECDREHPVWPNHGEINGGPFNVPFGTLNGLSAWGQSLEEQAYHPVYHPPLTIHAVRPTAPVGMTVRPEPDRLVFAGDYLSIGFSLRRAMVMQLGWDVEGSERGPDNRLRQYETGPGLGLSGPIIRTLDGNFPSEAWTGEVSVEGQTVRYANLRSTPNLSIDASFSVEAKSFLMELVCTCHAAMSVLEADLWRFVWDMTKGPTGVAAMPECDAGRPGIVKLPSLLVGDGVGCLSVSLIEGNPEAWFLRVDSDRPQNVVICSIGLRAEGPAETGSKLARGVYRGVFRFSLDNLEPDEGDTPPSGVMHQGLRRHWATVFSCFRPEFRGFSNNSASVNCHVNQMATTDIVALTRPSQTGVNPLDLARFTIGMAILDGGGYGYHRNLYLDSDPSLICSAGRIHQMDPQMDWLRKIRPGLIAAVHRILNTLSEDGLAICQSLSGNSGTYRWSSNLFDIVGFGHIDGYVNAVTYRALRNATALLSALGEEVLADRCRVAAQRIGRAYGAALINPETGWVAAWRSRDGQLHDHANLMVNGVALAFGLVDTEAAQRALTNLERVRSAVGVESARLGLPANLYPIDREDHMLPRMFGQINQTFEFYTNGGIYAGIATYYLRALARYGFKSTAHRIAEEMAEGYAQGMFTGQRGPGHEFLTWAGIPTGYEYVLAPCLAPLYSIAVEQGVIQPPDPEWWPRGG